MRALVNSLYLPEESLKRWSELAKFAHHIRPAGAYPLKRTNPDLPVLPLALFGGLFILESMKLNTVSRNKLPAKEFALPSERKYPVNDKTHAQLAKGRATQMFNQGKISASEKAKIHAKANRVLGKSFHNYPGN
jgi:hypothetical protein